ncbi:MAG: response regulator [Candidatus Pacebacteria bacterium]|nr:response regulator [Candidatus Paceibacterota bacterium]MDD5621512.1 response regulator [Candidatus Paceibacterota bacterium]
MAKKILIIEDEELLSGLLRRKFLALGFDVFIADDGEKGVQSIREINPDLVLLDIIMPKMSGFEVLKIVREDSVIANTKIIVISNSGQPVELDKAKELGAADWLIKTEFDPNEVVEKAMRLIGPAN